MRETQPNLVQYTGKPVPLDQKEQRPPTVNANRIEAIKDKLTSSDPEDLMLEIMDALNNTVEAIPTVGNYYTFVYNAKTAGKQYDQHPLDCLHRFIQVGIQGNQFSLAIISVITHGKNSQVKCIWSNQLSWMTYFLYLMQSLSLNK